MNGSMADMAAVVDTVAAVKPVGVSGIDFQAIMATVAQAVAIQCAKAFTCQKEPKESVHQASPEPSATPSLESCESEIKTQAPEIQDEPEVSLALKPRETAIYGSCGKRQREDVTLEGRKHAGVPKQSNEGNWAVGTSKRTCGERGNFDTYSRGTIDIDVVSQQLAPKGEFNLDPQINIDPAECEALIRQKGLQFGLDLTKQGINKRRTNIAKARSEKNACRVTMGKLDLLLNNSDQEEELFLWAESLRQLAKK